MTSQEMNDELLCRICLEPYDIGERIPLNLNCGSVSHTFCAYCLSRIKSQNSTISCPECRHSTSVPNSPREDLRVNLALKRMINNQTLSQEMRKFIDEVRETRQRIENLVTEKLDDTNISIQHYYSMCLNLMSIIHVCDSLLQKAKSMRSFKKIDEKSLNGLEQINKDATKCLTECKQARKQLIELRDKTLPDLITNPLTNINLGELNEKESFFKAINASNDDIEKMFNKIGKLGVDLETLEKENFHSLSSLNNKQDIKLDDLVDGMEYDMKLAKVKFGIIGNSGEFR
jgi:hypothetical protein